MDPTGSSRIRETQKGLADALDDGEVTNAVCIRVADPGADRGSDPRSRSLALRLHRQSLAFAKRLGRLVYPLLHGRQALLGTVVLASEELAELARDDVIGDFH